MNFFFQYFLILISFIAYYFLSFEVERSSYLYVVSLFFVLFGSAYYLFKNVFFKTKYLIWVGVAFRVLHLFSVPNLSDDYTRFLWDGRLVVEGMNPYNEVPEAVLEKGILDSNDTVVMELFTTLNSPGRHTIYPPINELIFSVSAFTGYESVNIGVFTMKVILFLFELLSLLLIAKILSLLEINQRNILLYALNPLIIVELMGNMHFEGTMMCFTLLAFYLLLKEKWQWSAVSLGFAICSKILPLIFLPLLFRRYGFKKTMLYSIVVGITVLLLFIPLLNETFFPHFMESFKLYFGLFEFNASLYYLFKWSYWNWWSGSLIVFKVIGLGVYSWYYLLYDKKGMNILKASGLILTLYLFFSQSIHPWYIIGPMTLLVFSEFRFVYLWGVLSVLSYSNYVTEPFAENYVLIFVEYLIVFPFFFYEFLKWKHFKMQREFKISDKNL